MIPGIEFRCTFCNTLIFLYTKDTYGYIETVCRKCKKTIPFIRYENPNKQ